MFLVSLLNGVERVREGDSMANTSGVLISLGVPTVEQCFSNMNILALLLHQM